MNVVTSVKCPVKGTCRCGGSGPNALSCVTGMSLAQDLLPSSSGLRCRARVGVTGTLGLSQCLDINTVV